MNHFRDAFLGSSTQLVSEEIGQPPSDSTAEDVADMSIDDLPDGVISSILESTAASARYPADFLSVTMT
jgi:hypothetical protein